MGIDLIVGDWYAEHTGKGRLGTSCIVAVTERGKKYAEKNLNGLKILPYNEILKNNELIERSIRPAVNRNKFFEKIRDFNYWDSVEELYPPKYKMKKILIRFKVYDLLKKIFG